MSYIVRSRQEWIHQLSELDPEVGLILVVAGLVYVLMGWRIFKVLIIINCAGLGAALGAGLGGVIGSSSLILNLGFALAGAVILGAAAVPLLKASVVLCAGLAGGFLGVVLAGGLSHDPVVQLVGGLVGLLAAVSLVFVVFEQVVIAVISFQGALMTTAGAVVAISQQMGFFRYFREMALKSDLLVPFCIVALTVIGVCVQLAALREGGTGAKSN